VAKYFHKHSIALVIIDVINDMEFEEGTITSEACIAYGQEDCRLKAPGENYWYPNHLRYAPDVRRI
jgi:hypothetical protein